MNGPQADSDDRDDLDLEVEEIADLEVPAELADGLVGGTLSNVRPVPSAPAAAERWMSHAPVTRIVREAADRSQRSSRFRTGPFVV
jgi:hypothetical protein